MQVFARKINQEYSLGFNNDTLSLAAKEFATNPRRIIQLFNNLSSELNLYSANFASKNESIICAIVILREEYYSFYKDAISNLKLLFGEYSKEEKYLKCKDEGSFKEEYNEVISFMRIADSYFKSSETSIILQILTNTEALFSSIPNEIQEAIRTNDIKKTTSFIQEQEEFKDDILRFIQKSITEDSKYGSELQMTNWLSFISQLGDEIVIEKSDYVKFDNELNK